MDRPYNLICDYDPRTFAVALGRKTELAQAVSDAARAEFDRNAPRLEDGGRRLAYPAHVNSVGLGAVALVQQGLDDRADRVVPSGAAEFLVATFEQRSHASLNLGRAHDAAPEGPGDDATLEVQVRKIKVRRADREQVSRVIIDELQFAGLR